MRSAAQERINVMEEKIAQMEREQRRDVAAYDQHSTDENVDSVEFEEEILRIIWNREGQLDIARDSLVNERKSQERTEALFDKYREVLDSHREPTTELNPDPPITE